MFSRIICLILLVVNLIYVEAQTSSNASGGDIVSGIHNISYSVGQVSIYNIESASYNINEGVQQPNLINIVNIKEPFNNTFNVSVFPNPVSENIIINIDKGSVGRNIVSIVNLAGETLSQIVTNELQIIIPAQTFPSGAYILSINNEFGMAKSFVVLKIN